MIPNSHGAAIGIAIRDGLQGFGKDNPNIRIHIDWTASCNSIADAIVEAYADCSKIIVFSMFAFTGLTAIAMLVPTVAFVNLDEAPWRCLFLLSRLLCFMLVLVW